jgi:hypothetical protein
VLGENTAGIELPLLLLLQKMATDQADDRGVVGEDAEGPSLAFDLLVQSLQQVALQILRQCSTGKLQNASTSSLASAISAVAAGNFSVSMPITCSHRAPTAAASYCTNTERRAAATVA